MTDIDDELLEGLTNNSAPVDRTPESIMRWFLNNYGTYNGAGNNIWEPGVFGWMVKV